MIKSSWPLSGPLIITDVVYLQKHMVLIHSKFFRYFLYNKVPHRRFTFIDLFIDVFSKNVPFLN
jgi:hypothetical protein